MTEPNDDASSVRAELARLGIVVPDEDIPFLQRTWMRQREVMRTVRVHSEPDSEPVLVFRPVV